MLKSAHLSQAAIDAALQCKWDEAFRLNFELLSEEPDDVCAMNRLARAAFELGDLAHAKKMYTRVLELDQYNAVALKNVKRLSQLRETAHTSRTSTSPLLSFIEEPGKTKIVQLMRTATPDVLITLRAGDQVTMIAKTRGVQILSNDNTYIGRLPDDVAFHLIQLMQSGNTYAAYLKQLLHNKVYVFIKEIYRNELLMPYPSFPQFVSSPAYAHVQPAEMDVL